MSPYFSSDILMQHDGTIPIPHVMHVSFLLFFEDCSWLADFAAKPGKSRSLLVMEGDCFMEPYGTIQFFTVSSGSQKVSKSVILDGAGPGRAFYWEKLPFEHPYMDQGPEETLTQNKN